MEALIPSSSACPSSATRSPRWCAARTLEFRRRRDHRQQHGDLPDASPAAVVAIRELIESALFPVDEMTIRNRVHLRLRRQPFARPGNSRGTPSPVEDLPSAMAAVGSRQSGRVGAVAVVNLDRRGFRGGYPHRPDRSDHRRGARRWRDHCDAAWGRRRQPSAPTFRPPARWRHDRVDHLAADGSRRWSAPVRAPSCRGSHPRSNTRCSSDYRRHARPGAVGRRVTAGAPLPSSRVPPAAVVVVGSAVVASPWRRHRTRRPCSARSD